MTEHRDRLRALYTHHATCANALLLVLDLLEADAARAADPVTHAVPIAPPSPEPAITAEYAKQAAADRGHMILDRLGRPARPNQKRDRLNEVLAHFDLREPRPRPDTIGGHQIGSLVRAGYLKRKGADRFLRTDKQP